MLIQQRSRFVLIKEDLIAQYWSAGFDNLFREKRVWSIVADVEKDVLLEPVWVVGCYARDNWRATI